MDKVLDMNIFSNLANKIETIAELNGGDYLDAVISYCEDNKLDLEIVGEIIQKIPGLVLRLQEQAEELHFLQPEVRLPF
jgi:hypothetical protein